MNSFKYFRPPGPVSPFVVPFPSVYTAATCYSADHPVSVREISEARMSRKAKTAFVTVGTTKFDELVAEVTKKETLDLLQSEGFENVIVQYGSGTIPNLKRPGFSCFDYKNDISKEMKIADLIISHGGAGSILEAVRCRRAKVSPE